MDSRAWGTKISLISNISPLGWFLGGAYQVVMRVPLKPQPTKQNRFLS